MSDRIADYILTHGALLTLLQGMDDYHGIDLSVEERLARSMATPPAALPPDGHTQGGQP